MALISRIRRVTRKLPGLLGRITRRIPVAFTNKAASKSINADVRGVLTTFRGGRTSRVLTFCSLNDSGVGLRLTDRVATGGVRLCSATFVRKTCATTALLRTGITLPRVRGRLRRLGVGWFKNISRIEVCE